MEVLKIGLQVILVTYFGLVLKQFEIGAKFAWELGLMAVVLLSAFGIIGYLYNRKAKKLDEEEAKERELA